MNKPKPIHHGESSAPDSHRIARSALASYIKTEIANPGKKPLAVLLVSLSRPRQFETITRKSAWELQLREIDERLARILRGIDRYARLSDEKLCIALPGLADGTQAVLAAARIVSTLREPFSAEVKAISLRASVGIAIWPDHGNHADQLVRCADMAAQIAARSAEDYHVIRAEDRDVIEMLDGDTEEQLLHAIRHNELSVHYQPQIQISTGRCIGAEALLRLTGSGVMGVSTATAVGIAETAGLITPLTFAVVNTVLRDAMHFRRDGVDVNLSVNVSTSILADLEFPEIVQQAIDTWDLPADSLTFEITESAMIGDVERSLLVLTRLRDMGIRLSIDDFGTGYSSLAYMKRFPVHELKIDKIFVANMLSSHGDRQIVKSVIDLSHNFSLQVVAEGVESQQTFDELKAMNCDIAQGFLFSPALAYDEFVGWLKAWRR